MQSVSLLLLAPLLALVSAAPRCPAACNCLGDLLHVVCENRGLRKIPRINSKIRLLSLQHNRFPVLPPNAFSSMKTLVSLHLQDCRIRQVSASAFRGLKKLVYLYLANNEISLIKPGAFQDLSELTYLYLDNNRISSLSKGLLTPLNSLFVMHLTNNRITQLKPKAFAGAKELRWLYLSGNGMTSILPGALDEVENLAALYLDKNQLSKYPAEGLRKLRVVEELNLSHNPIRLIPDNAFHSFGRYVERIWLDHMDLERFSENAFNGVTGLSSLHLGNNKLETLPNSLVLTKMQNMTLSNNSWQCNCALAPLRSWMDSSRNQVNAVCSSPSQYRGQQIRHTTAFQSCKGRTKRNKKHTL
ncbi:chondroadherin [Callorhinchus milii]|uniref:Chondroadherin n=1 Tax=Callorhinchus milii TaxID=7868 RepID=A0A4W3GC09_CALMI|nr:chondroadherin [Callorhinchus milii]|eukprot:gi/632943480/ref/XP_007886971.1/ PREDICTED: chondroadherin [Callorhinchus milii]